MTPSWWELEEYAAACRVLRASAIELGLDPDTALPEDILATAKDGNGKLIVCDELDGAAKRAGFHRRMAEAHAKD